MNTTYMSAVYYNMGARGRVVVEVETLTTNQEVAGSRPDEALGSTQPLTEMSTRNFPGSQGRPARKANNLAAIC
jgi:hypothetical protein